MKRLLVLLRINGEKILTKSSPRGFARKEIFVFEYMADFMKTPKLLSRDSHIEAIMLAVVRWCSGNHRAASLVGEKITRG